jgi:ADP-ribosylglycohydrolase
MALTTQDRFRGALLGLASGAVCGQIAGAFYGESGIPEAWLEKLTMAEEIRAMADQLGSANSTPS